MVRERRYIILLMDNAKCYKCENIDNLLNIKVYFLLPNTTSHLQPLDQDIIYSLKTQYHIKIKKVTKRTIINSLAKAGILPDDNDSNISDNKSDDNNFEDNIEEIQLLIDELPTINPLSIEEYINIDDKLIAEEELSLEEIIDIVKNALNSIKKLIKYIQQNNLGINNSEMQ
ncbi:11235_t:CDS:2, partial [Funneliformis geosporum]